MIGAYAGLFALPLRDQTEATGLCQFATFPVNHCCQSSTDCLFTLPNDERMGVVYNHVMHLYDNNADLSGINT